MVERIDTRNVVHSGMWYGYTTRLLHMVRNMLGVGFSYNLVPNFATSFGYYFYIYAKKERELNSSINMHSD